MRLAAALRGGYVASARSLLSGRGPAVKYHIAMTSRRKIWITEEFSSNHPALAKIIRDATLHAHAEGNNMNWVTFSSAAEFTAAKEHAIANKRSHPCLASAPSGSTRRGQGKQTLSQSWLAAPCCTQYHAVGVLCCSSYHRAWVH